MSKIDYRPLSQRRTRRIAKKEVKRALMSGNLFYARNLMWAATVKPGDYVSVIGQCNRKVSEVELTHYKCGGRSILSEVTVVTTTHHIKYAAPFSGCGTDFFPRMSVAYIDSHVRHNIANNYDNIVSFYNDWRVGDYLEESLRKLLALKSAVACGSKILDEHGELLSQFDYFSSGEGLAGSEASHSSEEQA